MTEPDGIGFEIDCLMLIDADEETINEIWTEATINVLNQNKQKNESSNNVWK